MGAAVLSALVLLTSHPAAAENVEGFARVIDGDTLDVRGKKVRLLGVDAPEKAQSCRDALGQEYACGQLSSDALTRKLQDRTVTCDIQKLDQYGRSVATCSMLSPAGLEDIGSWLVSNGMAVAYRYATLMLPNCCLLFVQADHVVFLIFNILGLPVACPILGACSMNHFVHS